jgi:hypothetical protein
LKRIKIRLKNKLKNRRYNKKNWLKILLLKFKFQEWIESILMLNLRILKNSKNLLDKYTLETVKFMIILKPLRLWEPHLKYLMIIILFIRWKMKFIKRLKKVKEVMILIKIT